MTEEQAERLLIGLFGVEGATNLTELESRAIALVLTNYGLPFCLTDEERGKAAYQLHIRNRFTDMVTARCAVESVLYKAEKHHEVQRKYKAAGDALP